MVPNGTTVELNSGTEWHSTLVPNDTADSTLIKKHVLQLLIKKHVLNSTVQILKKTNLTRILHNKNIHL
jgi:hypothetical protein